MMMLHGPRMPTRLAHQLVTALCRAARVRAAADADRARLDALMQQVCALRAAGECGAPELDRTAGIYARSMLAIASRAVGAM